MTAAFPQTVFVQRGDDDDKIIQFFVTDSGEPLPLSEIADIWFTVREGPASDEIDDSTAVFSASLLGGGISQIDDTSVLLELPHDLTVTWLENSYVHDVQIRLKNGKVVTTQFGPVRMSPDVTRSS